MEELKVLTLAEISEEAARETAELKAAIDAGAKQWGRWRYNPLEPPSLDHHDESNDVYEVLLNTCGSLAEVGDWVLHLGDKTSWVASADIGDFTRALIDLEQVGYHTLKR